MGIVLCVVKHLRIQSESRVCLCAGPCSFLLWCISTSTAGGRNVLQSHFAHCGSADGLVGSFSMLNLPSSAWFYEEEPGGPVGSTVGSCTGPLSVPVNEHSVEFRVGDVAVNEHHFVFCLSDGYGALLQDSCRAACARERKVRGVEIRTCPIGHRQTCRPRSTTQTSSQDESTQQRHCHCPSYGFLTGTGSN